MGIDGYNDEEKCFLPPIDIWVYWVVNQKHAKTWDTNIPDVKHNYNKIIHNMIITLHFEVHIDFLETIHYPF